MTTTEMNIVIAQFEGRKFYGKYTIDQYGGDTANGVPEMFYNSLWQWLIPAWFKCQAIIRQNPDYRHFDSLFYGAMRREKIEECHKVVYDFIVEYKKKEK